jgi:hypothetical protein
MPPQQPPEGTYPPPQPPYPQQPQGGFAPPPYPQQPQGGFAPPPQPQQPPQQFQALYQQQGAYPPPGTYPQPQPGGFYPPPPGGPLPPEPPKRNILGIVGLVLAVAGTILACVPGVLVAGWVMLPIALIVSIVSLFIKGRKWPGIVGLIVSVVGAGVAAVAFFFLLVDAVDDAIGDIQVSLSPSMLASDDAEEDWEIYPDDEDFDGDSAELPSGDPGARDNPLPIGSTISGQEFDVVVNSVTLNATEEVMAANEFNDPPPDGWAWAVVNVSITYTGQDSDSVVWVTVAYVLTGGEVVNSYDYLTVAPEPELDSFAELYTGGTATGNVAIAVPIDDAGLLRVTPGVFDTAYFVALQ